MIRRLISICCLACCFALAATISLACLRIPSGEPELLLLRYGISDYPENRIREGGRGQMIPFAWDFYLIRQGDQVILIDTGFSEQYLPGYREMFRLTEYGEPVDLLARAGFAPSDITGIILTHSHFDHAGSLPDFLQSEAIVYISEKEWRGFQAVKRDAVIRETMTALFAQGRLRLIGADPFSVPDTSLLLEESGGHTIGSLTALYRDTERLWRFSGDECYTTDLCLAGIGLPEEACYSREKNRAAIDRMGREYQNHDGARIFTMHDRSGPVGGVGVYRFDGNQFLRTQ
ncbi:MBL fold metallo-hydrolase [Leptonema illini]|uniref:Zn-dependent hydrolase n=1 Tax=Leptonema illini DSM 21528 TaxID=929563 RepID=H2CJH3_9LEPT|nr:MBL fold metallo-hydrolase [Leptonema illini]EHQ07130.1 Zn-dependent hydrolase [Leptonema illini DSM 21528]